MCVCVECVGVYGGGCNCVFRRVCGGVCWCL